MLGPLESRRWMANKSTLTVKIIHLSTGARLNERASVNKKSYSGFATELAKAILVVVFVPHRVAYVPAFARETILPSVFSIDEVLEAALALTLMSANICCTSQLAVVRDGLGGVVAITAAGGEYNPNVLCSGERSKPVAFKEVVTYGSYTYNRMFNSYLDIDTSGTRIGLLNFALDSSVSA